MQNQAQGGNQPNQPQMGTQRSYAMVVTEQESHKDSACYEGMISGCGFFCGVLGSIPCCCCFPNPFKQIQQGCVGLVTKFGRFIRAVDPGLYKINPFCEAVIMIDVRMKVEDIPRQMALTKDNVSVNIDSVLYWEITDPFVSTFIITDVKKALIERTQTTLRMVMGNRTLQDTIEHREQVASEIRIIIDEVAASWGVGVEAILIKDVILGPEVLTNMSAAATQKRLGESKVIAAQAEVNAAKLMREAADILNSPAAMQIRYLETLQSMASHAGVKVIFMPTDVGMGQGSRSDANSKASMKEVAIYEKLADN